MFECFFENETLCLINIKIFKLRSWVIIDYGRIFKTLSIKMMVNKKVKCKLCTEPLLDGVSEQDVIQGMNNLCNSE